MRSHDEFERSAFILFADYCDEIIPDTAEVSRLVENKWSVKSPIFHLSETVAKQLCQSLRISPETWCVAAGLDLVGDGTPKGTLVANLRYCIDCLQRGWHSAVFQHPVTFSCPIHGKPLRMGCPHCGHAIATTPVAIARNHLHCGNCDRSMAPERRRASVSGPVVQVPRLEFEPVRLALLNSALSGIARNPMRWDLPPSQIAESAPEARAFARHRAWNRETVKGLRSFQEESHEFEDASNRLTQGELNRKSQQVNLKTLGEIARVLKEYECLEDAPRALVAGNVAGRRLDEDMSAVSAAFWRTANTLGVLRQVRGEMSPPGGTAPVFGDWLPAHPQAMEVTLSCQVQCLFVWNVVHLRRLKYGLQVAWNDASRPELFSPPWMMQSEGGKATLRMRRRVGRHLIETLVRRYRRHRLLVAPEGLAISDALAAGDMS